MKGKNSILIHDFWFRYNKHSRLPMMYVYKNTLVLKDIHNFAFLSVKKSFLNTQPKEYFFGPIIYCPIKASTK